MTCIFSLVLYMHAMLENAHMQGGLLTLPANIRAGSKGLTETTNALAYFPVASFIKGKS
jgi:hypothetical protein